MTAILKGNRSLIKLDRIVYQADDFVLSEFCCSDVGHLNNFKSNGRCLAVSLKQAKLLETLRSDLDQTIPDLSDPNVRVFRKSKQRYYRWERYLIARLDE